MSNMLTFDPSIGSHIKSVLTTMKQMALENDCHVKANFNEVEIIINKDSDLDKVLETFHTEQDRRSKEYINSPEGIASQVKYESEYAEQQLRVNELLDNLPDFNSLSSVIKWFGELEKCGYITLSHRGIVEIFDKKGYYAGVNCGDDFIKGDKDNCARWLIGQALECIRDVGAICPMYSEFAKEWEDEFEGGKQMLDEQGKGRALFRALNNTITKKSKFIIMNKEAYLDFCEWAKLYYKNECFPDSFQNVQIVLDLEGSTYMKVVDSASDECRKRDCF